MTQAENPLLKLWCRMMLQKRTQAEKHLLKLWCLLMLQDVFQIGERVRCLVMGMDENFTRISLSTAELEVREGDIMYDKV